MFLKVERQDEKILHPTPQASFLITSHTQVQINNPCEGPEGAGPGPSW